MKKSESTDKGLSRIRNEIAFSFEKTLTKLKEEGFHWEEFQEVFPFGFLGIREPQYIDLVDAALDRLASDEQQTLLLDLLDSQWCVFIEQLWIANEFGGDPDRFAGVCHFALARLQINSNIRFSRKLPDKDSRRAMLNLGKEETLIDRIVVATASQLDEKW